MEYYKIISKIWEITPKETFTYYGRIFSIHSYHAFKVSKDNSYYIMVIFEDFYGYKFPINKAKLRFKYVKNRPVQIISIQELIKKFNEGNPYYQLTK